MKNKILYYLSILFVALAPMACSDTEDEFTDSIFIDEPPLNPASPTYAFDRYLEENYLKPYNLRFIYTFSGSASDLDYNIVPTEIEKSKHLAILIKYLWFDAYKEVAGPMLLVNNGPRIIHLIGSGAYNPRLGTIKLGQAEGGIKVTVYNCNGVDTTNLDPEFLNEYCFKTLHHEFAHILHQQKPFPKEFEKFTAGYYDPSYWQERTESVAASIGCTSPYASSQPREDFVETIANWIVKSDQWWDNLLDMASKPGVDVTGEVFPETVDGKTVLLSKLEICRKWMKESWNIELDNLRANVQERQKHINSAIAEGYQEIESFNE